MLLLDTLPMLGNVLLLCFFLFFIFGIVGVQLWAGLLRQRCYISETFQKQLMRREGFKEYVFNCSRFILVHFIQHPQPVLQAGGG